MGHTGTTSAFIALLIQHAVSVALPVADLERSSDSEPRNIYETTRTSGNSDAAGAAGDSGGSINLKKRDQIAIIVVASVVVVIGITSAVLYYLAKKRQWQVKASIRRSARRIAEPFSPRTPKTMTHGRTDDSDARRRTRDPNPSARKTAEQSRRAPTHRAPEHEKRAPNDRPREKTAADRSGTGWKTANNTRDVEKGKPITERKPSDPDSATGSYSTSEDEATATKSKPWMSFSKLLGRGK